MISYILDKKKGYLVINKTYNSTSFGPFARPQEIFLKNEIFTKLIDVKYYFHTSDVATYPRNKSHP